MGYFELSLCTALVEFCSLVVAFFSSLHVYYCVISEAVKYNDFNDSISKRKGKTQQLSPDHSSAARAMRVNILYPQTKTAHWLVRAQTPSSLFDRDLTVGDLQQGAVQAPRVPHGLDLSRLRRAAAGLDLLGSGVGLG